MSIVAKRLDGRRRHLVRKSKTMWRRQHCIRRVPAARERGTAAPLLSAHVYCGHGRPFQLLLRSSVMLLMGIQGCQTVSQSIDRSRILMYFPCLPLPIPFFPSSPHPLPFLPSFNFNFNFPLRSRPPDCGLGVWEGISSPADPGGARPPNAFWCIVGIN